MKKKSIQPTDRWTLLESLYSFHFRDTGARMTVYALAGALALAYALISDFVFGRPEQEVVIECAVLSAVLLMVFSLIYDGKLVHRLIEYFWFDTGSIMQIVFIRAAMAVFIVGVLVRILEILRLGTGQPSNPVLHVVSDTILNNLLPFLGLILVLNLGKAYSRNRRDAGDQSASSSQKNTP